MPISLFKISLTESLSPSDDKKPKSLQDYWKRVKELQKGDLRNYRAEVGTVERLPIPKQK